MLIIININCIFVDNNQHHENQEDDFTSKVSADTITIW